MLTWSLAALYCALVGLWGLLSVAVWWSRRREEPHLKAKPPDLDAYALARLDRGRFGLIEVMMAHLLQSGVLTRGAKWGEREFRVAEADDKMYRVAVSSSLPPDAHELERRFVAATERKPETKAIENAREVIEEDVVCDRIEARLIAAGLLHDESRRWRIASFGWTLCSIGLSWSIGRFIMYGGPVDDVTSLLLTVSTFMLMPIIMSIPDTASESEATPDGRLLIDRARHAHTELRRPVAAADVRLAVALFGESTRHSAFSTDEGIRDAYELLDAEHERIRAAWP